MVTHPAGVCRRRRSTFPSTRFGRLASSRASSTSTGDTCNQNTHRHTSQHSTTWHDGSVLMPGGKLPRGDQGHHAKDSLYLLHGLGVRTST